MYLRFHELYTLVHQSCLKNTLCNPKSGEQDDQIAPILAEASIPITASGMFVIKAATLSPFLTFKLLSNCAHEATFLYNSSKVSFMFGKFSFMLIKAILESLCLKRFSAKFSLAPENHFVSNIPFPEIMLS